MDQTEAVLIDNVQVVNFLQELTKDVAIVLPHDSGDGGVDANLLTDDQFSDLHCMMYDVCHV